MQREERAQHPETEIELQIEKSVLAYCGQAGLFAPVARPFGPAEGGAAADEPLPDRPVPNAAAVLEADGTAPAGRRVVAAVSGGADSMALLRILLALREKLNITVAACHVNHGLRGEAADRDEVFVRAQCRALGVPLAVFSARQMDAAPPPGAGEDWARRFRYGCFDRLGCGGGTLVATAHTLTDQAETLLFRLARGTGVHGAAGIPPRRGLYVRPLLCLTRAQTEAYCAAVGQPFVTDETNLTDAYARNRLRHYALPALEAANAGAERNIGRFCERMARTDAYFAARARELLEAAAAQAAPGGDPAAKMEPAPGTLAEKNAGRAARGPWALAPLQQADPLVLEAALHSLVSPVRDAEEKYIRLLAAVVQAGGGAVQLTDAVRFAVQGGCLYRLQRPCAADPAAPEIPFAPGEYALPGGYRLKIELICPDILEFPWLVHKKDLKNLADYAKITTLPVLRTRQAGDTFRPAGRGVTKRLKKLLNEQKIPPRRRGRLPLIAAGSQVLWLWDQGFAEGLAPQPGAGTVVRITQLGGPKDEWEPEEAEQ